jgi:hypothetical protein
MGAIMAAIVWYFTTDIVSSNLHQGEVRQGELLPSLGIRRMLTFHILISSSKTP